MPYITALCYLSSLLAYRMGYLEMLVFKNAVIDHVNNYDYNIHVSLATSYFVLAIFFAVIGFLFYYVKNNRAQEIIEINDIEFRGKAGRESDDRERASLLEVRFNQRSTEYVPLDRMKSS